MATKTCSVATTELARHFGEYLSRVRFGGERFVVLKNNVPVAELRRVPGDACKLEDFLGLYASVRPDDGFAGDLAEVDAADQVRENPWD